MGYKSFKISSLFLCLSACLLAFCLSGVAVAASPVDVYNFESPEQERRYRGLTEEFRCPKCLNTNIAGSDAPIAQDLRRTVHRLVVTDGYSDQQVRDFLQERYGDFVLYDPPFTARTAAIWLIPAILGVIAFGVLIMLLMRARRQTVPELDDSARARAAAILRDD